MTGGGEEVAGTHALSVVLVVGYVWCGFIIYYLFPLLAPAGAAHLEE